MLIFANELSLKLKNGINKLKVKLIFVSEYDNFNEIINFHSGAAVY